MLPGTHCHHSNLNQLLSASHHPRPNSVSSRASWQTAWLMCASHDLTAGIQTGTSRDPRMMEGSGIKSPWRNGCAMCSCTNTHVMFNLSHMRARFMSIWTFSHVERYTILCCVHARLDQWQPPNAMIPPQPQPITGCQRIPSPSRLDWEWSRLSSPLERFHSFICFITSEVSFITCVCVCVWDALGGVRYSPWDDWKWQLWWGLGSCEELEGLNHRF